MVKSVHFNFQRRQTVLHALLFALLLMQDSASLLGEKLIQQALEQDKRDAPLVKSFACASIEEMVNLDEKDREHKRKLHLSVQDWLGTSRYSYRVLSEFPVTRTNGFGDTYLALQVVFSPNPANVQPVSPPNLNIEQRAMYNVLNKLRGVIYLDPVTLGIHEIEGFQFGAVKVAEIVEVYNTHVDYLQKNILGVWVPSKYNVNLRGGLREFHPISRGKAISSTYFCSPPPPAR